MARRAAKTAKTARPSRGPAAPARRPGLRLLLAACGVALVAFLGLQLASLPSSDQIARLKTAQVRDTEVMRQRVDEAAARGKKLKPRQQWVELEQISKPAITAVLTSEDARFFSHGALDLKEMGEAIQDKIEEGRPLRGASTLTQQVAKNLYFGNDRSFLRKAKEAYVAWRMEETLSKRRILRLYLNIAEWGPGVFGIEAAAQTHLKKHASELSLAEGAALAAMLPNPLRFTPQAPKVLRRHAGHVLDRCLDDRVATAEEIAAANTELDRWLGPEGGAKVSEDD
ncbi:MAG TPA: monofunctional biosynthetic peptidoglycan transglycosylase [Myxococcales bacterium]|jgi:monofunctional biosynthetic peptidoglycan transglycosylase